MDKYVKVPVVDIHKDNISQLWTVLVNSIYQATFIALDTELSGLGDRRKLVAKSIEDRYSNLVDIAKSRAILALGISCFEEDSDGKLSEPMESSEIKDINTDITGKESSGSGTKYRVHTYNLSVLCDQEFVVEPASLKFLIQHGFDFNKQFSKGISYQKGSDKEQCDYTHVSVRNLFAHLLLANKPIVVHNGLLDLVFLYHNFYSTLPNKLEVFTSDVHGMFSAGVLDTKYIAEYQLREPASYLSYLFRKSQRYNTNCKDSSEKHIKIEFSEEPAYSHWIEYLLCHEQAKKSDESAIQICDIYAAHGYCPRGTACHLSHDIDHILNKQETKAMSKKKKRSRKRKMNADQTGRETGNPSMKKDDSATENTAGDQTQLSENNLTTTHDRPMETINTQSKLNNKNITPGGHRAGIDAYMTGYCLATYLVQGGCRRIDEVDWVNKITLSGKEHPLTLVCSHFSKPSVLHTQKMGRLKEKLLCKKVSKHE